MAGDDHIKFRIDTEDKERFKDVAGDMSKVLKAYIEMYSNYELQYRLLHARDLIQQRLGWNNREVGLCFMELDIVIKKLGIHQEQLDNCIIRYIKSKVKF